jgi:hypothetical protein
LLILNGKIFYLFLRSLSVPVLFFFPDVMDRGSPRFGQAIVLFDLIFAMVYLPF